MLLDTVEQSAHHFAFYVFDLGCQDAVVYLDWARVWQAFVFGTEHGGYGSTLRVELQALNAHEQFAHIVVDYPEPFGLTQEGDQIVIADEVEAREFSPLFFQLSQ